MARGPSPVPSAQSLPSTRRPSRPRARATLHDVLEQRARRTPKRVAVVVGNREVRYKELWQQIASVSRQLSSLAVPDDHPVAFCISDPLLAVIWILGAMKSGRVPAILPDRGERQRVELPSSCHTLGLTSIITDHDDFRWDIEHRVTTLDNGMRLLSEAGGIPSAVPPLPTDRALVLFTSGTTGEPRPVLHGHRALLFTASRLHELQREFFSGPLMDVGRRLVRVLIRSPRAALRSIGHQIWMTNLGESSISGWTLLIQALYSGHTIVLSRSHVPREIFRIIQERRVTMFATVPAVLRVLVASSAHVDYDLSSLMVVGVGGGFVPPELAESVRRRLSCEVAIGYGSTELGGGVLVTRPYDSLQARFGTVGRPFPGVSLSVRNAEGAECQEGVAGELWCRTPGGMTGYLDTPSTQARIDEEAWFRTHDLAVREVGGTFRVVGRSDDMIVRGGRKIAPIEVERQLMTLDLLDGVVVAGIREPDGEDGVHAWVVLKPGIEVSAAGLRSRASSQLPPWCVPQYVHLVTGVPRTHAGDPWRRQLVEDELLRAPRRGEMIRSRGQEINRAN